MCAQEDETRASDMLRKFINDLRKKLDDLGRPPTGKGFIVTARHKGYHLNFECNWQPDEEVKREYSRLSQSVAGRWMDPQLMAKNTADKDHKLPAKLDRPNNRRLDEEE